MRVKFALLTFISGAFFSLLTSLVSFATTPLLLRWLGNEDYGIFRILADYFHYLTIFELGLANALLPMLIESMDKKNGNDKKLLDNLAVGLREYSKVIGVMFLASLAIAVFFPLLIKVPEAKVDGLRVACLFVSVSIVISIFTPIRSLAEASQRGYLVNIGNFLRFLVFTGLGLLLAWWGFGARGQITAVAMANMVIFAPVLAWALYRYGPGLLGSLTRNVPAAIELNRKPLRATQRLYR